MDINILMIIKHQINLNLLHLQQILQHYKAQLIIVVKKIIIIIIIIKWIQLNQAFQVNQILDYQAA